MARSEPTQERSRQRVEQILQAAENELVDARRAEKLSTTRIAQRAGIPVSSVYRYFADRWSIVDALMTRELRAMDKRIARGLEESEVVSIDSLFALFVGSSYDYFAKRPRAVVLWFETRQSDVVMNRVAARYKHMGSWLASHCEAAGLARDFPDWGAESIVWILDRVFELMFMEGRSDEDRIAMMREGVEMLRDHLERYATEAGLDGIQTEEFIRKAGPYVPEA